MLDKLYKLAYELDRKGLYDEAEAIEQVMKTLSQRVGLSVEELVSLANYFDAKGEIELADQFDALASKKSK